MKSITIIIFALMASVISMGQSTEWSDSLYIKLGDKLVFEAKYDSANHLTFKQGTKSTNKSITVSVRLHYTESSGTMLEIINPFDKQMIYKAELYSFKKEDYVETSTVPVFPKLSSFETWPFKIDRIRLTNFKLEN